MASGGLHEWSRIVLSKSEVTTGAACADPIGAASITVVARSPGIVRMRITPYHTCVYALRKACQRCHSRGYGVCYTITWIRSPSLGGTPASLTRQAASIRLTGACGALEGRVVWSRKLFGVPSFGRCDASAAENRMATMLVAVMGGTGPRNAAGPSIRAMGSNGPMAPRKAGKVR